MAHMKSALLQVATSCQRWRKIKAKAIHLSEAISVYGCPVDASGLVMQEVRKKSAYIPRHLAVASKMVHQCTSPLWNICNFQVKNTSLILFPGQLKSTLVPFLSTKWDPGSSPCEHSHLHHLQLQSLIADQWRACPTPNSEGSPRSIRCSLDRSRASGTAHWRSFVASELISAWNRRLFTPKYQVLDLSILPNLSYGKFFHLSP